MRGHHHRTKQLDYIQSMLRELVDMSKAQRHDVLAWLIEMAYFEASDIIRGDRPPRAAQQGARRDIQYKDPSVSN